MNLKEAIDASGGVTAVAASLLVSPQRLNNWVERGVPVDRCAAVEAAVNGLVTRADLRPEDWQAIWPELVEAKAA